MQIVELPTPRGPLWVNPDHVVSMVEGEVDRTHLSLATSQTYTIDLPVDTVARMLESKGQGHPATQAAEERPRVAAR
jgi:hypothetical protein